MQIWSIIALGWERSFERYGLLTLYATFIEAMVFLVFGAFTETAEKYMHFWLLMIPLAGFAAAFIWACGRARGKMSRLEKEKLAKIQQEWLRSGESRQFRGRLR